MKNFGFISAIVCACICISASSLQGQGTVDENVVLGSWLQEGSGSVTGSGDTFTATPIAAGIADNGNNFALRNLVRHRVHQSFSSPQPHEEIIVTFDVAFAGTPNLIDSGFRMSLLSGNRGFYPIAFDTGARSGTYNRSQFVDDPGDLLTGEFYGAFLGSGTVTQSAAAPTITNGATEIGLVDGNKLSFEVVVKFCRGHGYNCPTGSFSFTTNVTEANGNVVYEETAGSYAPSNFYGRRFDTIVFGIFDDTPFAGNGSYTVSDLTIKTVRYVLVGDVDRSGGVDFADIPAFIYVMQSGVYQAEADVTMDGVVDFYDIGWWICILAGAPCSGLSPGS